MTNRWNLLGTVIRSDTPKLWGDTDYIQEIMKFLNLGVIKSIAGVKASHGEDYSHCHFKVYFT